MLKICLLLSKITYGAQAFVIQLSNKFYMRKHNCSLIIAGMALATASAIMAMPAKRGLMTVTTADGTPLTVRLCGDEYFHQYLTEDGYPLLERDGDFYYCSVTDDGDIIDSGIKAADKSVRSQSALSFLNGIDTSVLETGLQKRAAMVRDMQTHTGAVRQVRESSGQEDVDGPPYERGYGLFPESRGPNFPAYGDRKGLVILVEYQDVAFRLDDPHDYFSRMLNEDGFSDYGATGCAAEYFRFNSMNEFRPVFDVYGPVKLSRNRSYYGQNDNWGNDSHPEQMVIEALNALDPEVDFSQYDCDNDGLIDNVFIFYADRGESSGGGPETVWPHANSLSKLNESGHVFDGVEADRYGCTNEWTGSRPDGVGTFIHEFGHILGLPDIYATTYTSAFTPGEWSVMDYGSYNNSGMTPPLYGAFERYALGWIEPRPIDRAVTAQLAPVEDNAAGIIRTGKDTEFFLVENRQQTGWDTYIPGHGMLVWHIDYNERVWNSNAVNNIGAHQYVDLEEADGKRTDSTRAGDAFPGTEGITSFTASTRPSMTTWNDEPVNFPITDISERPDGMVTFNVLGGNMAPIPDITDTEAKDITADGFTIEWTPAEGYDHLVSVYVRDEDGNAVHAAGYRARNCGGSSSLAVTGLEPETSYLFTVTASDGWTPGTPSAEKTVTTDRLNLSYFAVTSKEATEITSTGFTANWEAMQGASGYLVSVSRRIPGEPYGDGCGFDDGVVTLPAGWESTSAKSYGMSTYCGEAVPSLRLGKNGDMLATPVYGDGISMVGFWMRGSGTDGSARIVTEGLAGDEWITVTDCAVVAEAGGRSVRQDIPEGITRVRLRFVPGPDGGAVAIDDVTVAHGMQYSLEAVDGCSPAEAGDAESFAVNGLIPDTEYVYTVSATDGDYTSRSSDAVFVRTAAGGGISGVDSIVGELRLEGRLVIAAPGQTVEAFDVAGRLVARGTGSVRLPHAGIYLLRIPSTGKTVKHTVR